MTESDDPIAGVDLDAWQPPAPPDGIADAVLRRMNEPVAVAARELGERRWRWPVWLGAGAVVAAAAAGLAVFAPWRAAAPPLPSTASAERGAVVADRPSHLELGAGSASAAELDAGATLSWRRDGRLVEIAQLRGAATWRAAGEDTLVIDAGAMGASVEASGASLRVEVDMRISLSDARVVSASAVTAAAVALVTVVVYQGHVKVTSAGQTVNVGAGGAVEIKPGEPARDVHAVATTTGEAGPAPATVAAGAATPVGSAPVTATVPSPVAAAAVTLDAAAIKRGLATVEDGIAACLAGQRQFLTAVIVVRADGKVDKVDVTPSGIVASCLTTAIGRAQFDATPHGGKFERRFEGDPDAIPGRNITPRDLDALRIKGEKNIMPDPFVQRSMVGETRVVAAIKLCVDATGKVGRVILLKSSGYPAYDEKIVTETKAWEYKPYVIDGKPVPVCTALTFIYQQK